MRRITLNVFMMILLSGSILTQKMEAADCEIQDLKCVQAKMQIGEFVDLYRKNSKGKTSLHYAVEENNLDLVKLIVPNNISILNIEDRQGNTILHKATTLNRAKILEFILDYELEINRTDRNGETALDLANASGYSELSELLKTKGGEIKKGNRSETALWVYGLYIFLSIAITIWVAQTLSKNGKVFLIDAFHNQELADSVNHLLVVGFYLINLGYITIALKIGLKPSNAVEALEILSTKIGLVILILGVMHFFNLYLFGRLRKRTLLKRELGISENIAVVKPAL